MSDVSWDAAEFATLLRRCVGPRDDLVAIREERRALAEVITHDLALTEHDVVLDFGSGLGFIARWLANRVAYIHCVDISKDFLGYCQAELNGFANVGFHHVRYGELPPLNITAIYASAVFIHFNVYDLCLHLQRFFALLPSGGRLWFDYKEVGFLSMLDTTFQRHMQLYAQDRSRLERLLCYHSGDTIESIACQIGFLSERRTNIFVLRKP